MKDLIGVYDDAVSSEFCQNFMNYMDEMENNSLLVQEEKDRHITDNKVSILSHSYDLAAWSYLGREFFGSMNNCVTDYLDTYSILKKDRFLLYDLKVKKIPAGGGFHAWHYENGSVISATRSFVVQLYLNTIEEAGETEFLYMSKRINAKQGRVVIFPAGYSHTHRGNPPIGQDKYIATSWGMIQEQA